MPHPLSSFPPAMTPAHDVSQATLFDDFVAEETLAKMIDQGEAQRDGCLLRLRDGRRFALREAVRILGHVSQETDPYGLTGHTETLAVLLERGFVVSAGRVALGRQVYDTERGYLAQRIGNPDASGVNPVIR